MAKLTDFRLLSFDVYGTLIEWERGILTALQPLLKANNREDDIPKEKLLEVLEKLERAQQAKTPEMPYCDLLATVHPQVAQELGLKAPTKEESQAFGQSIGTWPAFPDTVSALHRLAKYYKLVVLSNVDRHSFSASHAGPLQGFPFDLVLTAQDIGSYKPDHRNFEYMLEKVESKFGVEKHQVLQTAQSQFHDHKPAKALGIRSVWIARKNALMGTTGEEVYDWRFNTLGEMTDAVEEEAKMSEQGNA